MVVCVILVSKMCWADGLRGSFIYPQAFGWSCVSSSLDVFYFWKIVGCNHMTNHGSNVRKLKKMEESMWSISLTLQDFVDLLPVNDFVHLGHIFVYSGEMGDLVSLVFVHMINSWELVGLSIWWLCVVIFLRPQHIFFIWCPYSISIFKMVFIIHIIWAQ